MVMARGVSRNDKWHSSERLLEWFSKLTPEERLDIALETEQFRREARKQDLKDSEILEGQ